MPYVDAHYPTLPYKLLIGHSLGGLLVINTLVHHPQMFNAYIAIDPSMWWDKRRLLSEAKTTLPTRNYAGKALFVGIANSMWPVPMDTLQVQKDTMPSRDHIRSILALHHLMKANPQTGLRYKGSYYEDDSHGSVPLISEYDALHFLFKDYNFEVDQEREFSSDDTLLAQKYTDHFAAVSRSWGTVVVPPEETISGIAYFTLSLKLYKKAESLFKLNLTNYPQNPIVYECMGDYYAARQDTASAINYYHKSLALKETPDARKKLTGLTGKPATESSAGGKPKK